MFAADAKRANIFPFCFFSREKIKTISLPIAIVIRATKFLRARDTTLSYKIDNRKPVHRRQHVTRINANRTGYRSGARQH